MHILPHPDMGRKLYGRRIGTRAGWLQVAAALVFAIVAVLAVSDEDSPHLVAANMEAR